MTKNEPTPDSYVQPLMNPITPAKSCKLKRLALTLFALLALNTTTFFLFAKSRAPVSALRHLADYPLLYQIDFIIIDPQTWSSLAENQRATLLAELKTHTATIYFDIIEVPEEKIIYEPMKPTDYALYAQYQKRSDIPAQYMQHFKRQLDAGKRMVGLNRGMQLSWKLNASGPFYMTSSPAHYVSAQGAEWRTDTYIWFFFWWIPIHNTSHTMA
jgi:hypothetical protein